MAAIKKHVLTRRQQKYIRIKRILDLGMASAATVILSPVLLGISIAIRLDSPGPVFFRQKRVGIHKTYHLQIPHHADRHAERHADTSAERSRCVSDQNRKISAKNIPG